jgi:hypothetical protein
MTSLLRPRSSAASTWSGRSDGAMDAIEKSLMDKFAVMQMSHDAPFVCVLTDHDCPASTVAIRMATVAGGSTCNGTQRSCWSSPRLQMQSRSLRRQYQKSGSAGSRREMNCYPATCRMHSSSSRSRARRWSRWYWLHIRHCHGGGCTHEQFGKACFKACRDGMGLVLGQYSLQ